MSKPNTYRSVFIPKHTSFSLCTFQTVLVCTKVIKTLNIWFVCWKPEVSHKWACLCVSEAYYRKCCFNQTQWESIKPWSAGKAQQASRVFNILGGTIQLIEWNQTQCRLCKNIYFYKFIFLKKKEERKQCREINFILVQHKAIC